MENTSILELAKDVIITSVRNLREDIRLQLNCEETDFIVTRPQGRARSLIIEEEVAEFLETFRQPTSLTQAVEHFSQQKEKETDAFLHDIEDSIRQLIKTRILITPGAHPVKDYSLVAGDQVGGATILHGINIMDDTEIYRCSDSSGRPLVLKIAKSENDRRINMLIGREYDILSVAPHPLTPLLCKAGKHRNRSYLLMDWREGQDILSAANKIRKSSPDTYPYNQLMTLVINILRAYEALHNAGIVHGDIHPNNCLVDAEGRICIIDFGLSLHLNGSEDLATYERTGVPYFYDPSFATAYLNKTTAPFANIGTDLYSLAALSYFLLTGHHYLPFRLDHKQFYEQIKSEDIRSFISVGRPAWPEAESILSKALSKDEQERFFSVGELADALSLQKFIPGKTTITEKKSDPAMSRAAIARYQRTGLDFDWPLPAPTASMHFGAGGIAYTLLKCAEKSNDAAVLSDADIWITRAKQEKAGRAFLNESMGLNSATAAPYALHYGNLGVNICDALIACARWDCPAVNKSLSEICNLALSASNDFDLTYGKAGCLLGCALLLEAIPDDPLLPMKHTLRETGKKIATEITGSLRLLGKIATNKVLCDYGMAHGWAGVLYALMRWAEATQTLPDNIVKQYLNELAHLSVPAKTGRSWPVRTDTAPGKTDTFSASWCKGASGFVHLFGLGTRVFKKPFFLDIAREAADYSFTAPQNGASLCCGDAGIAYAQMSMFRRTGEDKYLERARFLADRAVNTELKSVSSLYKGRLGIHLLILDLEDPAYAGMPFFETIS